MKLIDTLKGKPATAPATPTNKADSLRKMLSHLTHAAFIAFCAAMTYCVYALGRYYGLPEIYCVLVASGSAAGLLGHGSAVTRPTTNTSRTMHGLALGTWLVLSLFLAALYMFASSEQLAAVLPADMVFIGAVVYSLAFAIGLCTSVVALVVPSVAEKRIAGDGEHASLGSVVSKYGETVAIIIAIAVSSFHIFQFGQKVAKLDLFSIITATIMADLAFLAAEKRVVSELKKRSETGRYDRFDLVLWGIFGLAVIAYLVLVNLYTVRYSAGTLDMTDPLFRLTLDFYGASPSILLFMLAALSIITALVDSKVGENPDAVQAGKPFAIKAADTIRGAKAGWHTVKSAVREPAQNAPQLPAGITLADDGPQLEAWRDGDKFAWSVKRGGAVVASGKADTMDAAKAAANQAGGVSTQTVDASNWLGKFVFVFNGESDYDEGEEIKSRADELMGEIGMRVKHGSPIGLEFWVFDKETFTSTSKMVNGQPMRFALNSMTVECSVTGFTRAANGSVTHAEVAADVFFKGGMTEAEARKLVAGVVKPDSELMVSGKKVSKNGTIYDETGVEVSPAEAAELMRRHREMLDREGGGSPKR